MKIFKKYNSYAFYKISLCMLCITLLSSPVFAWEGYDYDKGAYVEIEDGNLVRSGETIEIYDYNDGEYKEVEVESIYNNGNSVEIEVFDNESGEYRTFEME